MSRRGSVIVASAETQADATAFEALQKLALATGAELLMAPPEDTSRRDALDRWTASTPTISRADGPAFRARLEDIAAGRLRVTDEPPPKPQVT